MPMFARVLLFILIAAAGLPGCANSGKTETDSDSPAYARKLNYGPFDASARRSAGIGTESLFTPMDYETPNERRLGSGAPGPAYWQQRVDYDIDVRIDRDNDSVHGSQRVTYHNNSPHRLDHFWIQLEQNLFNPKSLGARSHTPRGVLRGRPTFEGGYDIPFIRSGGRDLEFTVYDTLARVELPEPIEPGQVWNYELDWSFEIAPYLRRMGVEEVDDGKVFELAQWFPHACNYDDVHGWNTLPYLGTGEFYTNFGTFTVDVTVPSSYIVTATGTLTNESDVLSPTVRDRLSEAMSSDEPVWIISPDEVGDESLLMRTDGEMTWSFRAEDVRTFAFAASDAFVWDACKADVNETDGSTRAVRVQSLYPKEATVWSPEHEDGGSTRTVKHSIEYYSDWLFPYPYPHMTNVNGPEDGMEYPMIVFCGGRTGARGMQNVTDHEVGHSWFPMIVNTDERRHVWMDEGFNTFINVYAREAMPGRDRDLERAFRQTLELARAGGRQPIMLAPDYMWRQWVGNLGYRKTGMGLVLLRELILGPERFDLAFREYISRWAFKSPQPDDFFRSMEDSAGMDLGWFWKGWFQGTGEVDFAVESAALAEDGESGYVTFRNEGGVVLPLPYRVTYDDGTAEDHELPVQAWAQTDRWRAIVDAKGREIVKVELDPGVLIPETDKENNVWER